MSEGIDQVKVVLGSAIEMVNAEQKLVSVDWKVVYRQVLDLDEKEASELAASVGLLDLSNDELEAKIEGVALVAGQYAAFVLRMLKIVLPKPVVNVVGK